MENTKTSKMENQETNTKITEEFNKEIFNEMIDEFIENHDYGEAPSVQTKTAAAWTRKNIVLDSWNHFINFEARMSEYIGIHPEGKGFRALNNRRRCDIALSFAHWFLAAMEEQVKSINEEYPESLK